MLHRGKTLLLLLFFLDKYAVAYRNIPFTKSSKMFKTKFNFKFFAKPPLLNEGRNSDDVYGVNFTDV